MLLNLSARIRKSPFHQATLDSGVKGFTVYNRMYMPTYYVSPEEDYWPLIRSVSLWDVAVERQVEITGPDAAKFVQLLTPRNLSKCKVGQCKYVLITAEDGGIVNDPVLLRLAENHFWLSLADSDVLLYAKGVAVHSGLDVTLCEPDVSPVQVQGPHSADTLAALFGDWINELQYFHCREAELHGIPLLVSRTGWSGEKGFEVYLGDGSRGTELWERIMRAGQPYGIAPGSPSQIRRIEAGIYSYGADMTTENNPFEVGLGRLVDTELEADFIGKAALQRIKEAGVTRKLVGVEIDGEPLPAGLEDCLVFDGNSSVGKLTSSVYSPRLKQNLGFAMVPLRLTEPGTALDLRTPEGTRSATVVPIPFFDLDKQLAKS